jgi:hypothetical protein
MFRPGKALEATGCTTYAWKKVEINQLEQNPHVKEHNLITKSDLNMHYVRLTSKIMRPTFQRDGGILEKNRREDEAGKCGEVGETVNRGRGTGEVRSGEIEGVERYGCVCCTENVSCETTRLMNRLHRSVMKRRGGLMACLQINLEV